MKSFSISILVLSSALIAQADTIPDINLRVETMSDPLIDMTVYNSPVVMQWMGDVSLSGVNGRYYNHKQKRDVNPQLGEGEDRFAFDADSYMKYKSSTLWGGASYTNGHRHNVRYNESADIGIIYPYVTADTVGGNINYERYAFYGGYADHEGRMSWGASISYTAGLEFRNVDPRPKNVTGLLDIDAGIGYNLFADYDATITLSLRRYTQSGNIMFKSEMGVDKIYHLTGPGNHYYRFAGTGFSSHYGGYRYGAAINLHPLSRKGLAMNLDVSRFAFDKVLKDLNELPLVSAWHNAIAANISWLAPGHRHDWAVMAGLDAYRRHGSENIFGDPSSNIYTQIGSLEMYADNHYGYSITALYAFHTPTYRIWAKPTAGYSHRRQIYADPPTEVTDNHRYFIAESGASLLSGAWRWQIDCAYLCNRNNNILQSAISVDKALTDVYALSFTCGLRYGGLFRSFEVSCGVRF